MRNTPIIGGRGRVLARDARLNYSKRIAATQREAEELIKAAKGLGDNT